MFLTHLSKSTGVQVRNGSQMAVAALFTNASKWPSDSTTVRVFSQSAMSTSTISIEGYSLCRVSKCTLVLDSATIFAPARHSSIAIPRPIPVNHRINIMLFLVLHGVLIKVPIKTLIITTRVQTLPCTSNKYSLSFKRNFHFYFFLLTIIRSSGALLNGATAKYVNRNWT